MLLDHMPCRDQDGLQIKKWFGEYAAKGLIVAIRTTQGGFEGYMMDEIIEIRLKPQKKFFTQNAHAYGSGYSPNGFFFSGISTAAPTSQKIRAVIPTPIITEYALLKMWFAMGSKTGTSPNSFRCDEDFTKRARKQYQDLFPGWTIEKAKNDAKYFYNNSDPLDKWRNERRN